MRRDGLPRTVAGFDSFARRYGSHEDAFRGLCGVSCDSDVEALFSSDVFTGMIAGTHLFGTVRAREGRTTYIYEFDPNIPDDKCENVGSFHGAELWFAYDSLARSWRPFRGKHYDLARKVSAYWANFVKAGDPNGTDAFGDPLPRWHSYTEDDPFVLGIRNEIGPVSPDRAEVLSFRIGHTLGTL